MPVSGTTAHVMETATSSISVVANIEATFTSDSSTVTANSAGLSRSELPAQARKCLDTHTQGSGKWA